MSARTRRLSSPVSTQAASAASLRSPVDEVACRPLGVDRTDDAGSTAGEGREDEERRRLHLEVHDALARHLLREVRVADGQLRDGTPLRPEESRSRRRDPDVVPMTEPLGGLDERDDRLVIGDRRVPIVDEEARRRLEADGSRGDDQVPQAHLRLERPAGADPDEGRPFGDREDLRHHDLDVVRADAGRDDRHALARDSVPVTEANSRCRRSSSTESRRAAIRAVRSGSPGRRMYSASSPGPRPMWYCRSPDGIAILRSSGVSTRLSAFGKSHSSLRWLLRKRETRPRIVPPSHERQAEWSVLSSRSAERGGR